MRASTLNLVVEVSTWEIVKLDAYLKWPVFHKQAARSVWKWKHAWITSQKLRTKIEEYEVDLLNLKFIYVNDGKAKDSCAAENISSLEMSLAKFFGLIKNGRRKITGGRK